MATGQLRCRGDGLLQRLDAALDRRLVAAADEVASAKVGLVGSLRHRRRRAARPDRGAHAQRVRHLHGDLLVPPGELRDVGLERLRPQVDLVVDAPQADGDPQVAVAAVDVAAQHVVGVQSLADLVDAGRAVAVDLGRAHGDDPQPVAVAAGEVGDELFGDHARHCGVKRREAGAGERQHRQPGVRRRLRRRLLAAQTDGQGRQDAQDDGGDGASPCRRSTRLGAGLGHLQAA